MSAPTEVERPDAPSETTRREEYIWALLFVVSGLIAGLGYVTETVFTTFVATMCASICFAFLVFTFADL